jgi:23S rRNA C2498 (ribose-2'-O)-methylase RlmM
MTTIDLLHSDIHRRSGDAIDFAFCRDRAITLRSQLKREARLTRYAAIGVVTLIVAFVAALTIAAGYAYAPHGETVVIQTGEPRFE